MISELSVDLAGDVRGKKTHVQLLELAIDEFEPLPLVGHAEQVVRSAFASLRRLCHYCGHRGSPFITMITRGGKTAPSESFECTLFFRACQTASPTKISTAIQMQTN